MKCSFVSTLVLLNVTGLSLLIVLLSFAETTVAYPPDHLHGNGDYKSRIKRNYFGYDSDLQLANLLESFPIEPIDYEFGYRLNHKRGLDLGLNRGFSGNQAAKQLLGLAAANLPNGPGRRRRSLSD